MAKFAINASGAMMLPSLVQVSESISGSVVPLAMVLLLSLYLENLNNRVSIWKLDNRVSIAVWHLYLKMRYLEVPCPGEQGVCSLQPQPGAQVDWMISQPGDLSDFYIWIWKPRKIAI